MTTAIRFEAVSKRYRLGLTRTSLPTLVSQWIRHALARDARVASAPSSIWAVRHLSFQLNHGDSLALIGPNGAGKSTILKLLARITTPTIGSIQVRGRLSALIELGAGFHPDLTGRDNIYLNGAVLGLNRAAIARRLDEIIAFSELERFIDTPVKRYSSGMIVRLGFAVATCIEPEILLVDEVLAVGDAAFRQKCLQRIESLLARGTCLLFVSHNLYHVQAICREALYLENGEAQHRGPTEEVIRAYERALHEQRARKLEAHRAATVQAALEIEITSVRVGPLGTDTELRSQHPAQVRVHYQAYGACGPLGLALHILRADGLVCCMARTSLDRIDIVPHVGGGCVTATFDPIQLISGAYYAEAHFVDANDCVVLTRGSSDWFSVHGVGRSHEQRSGVFEPRVRWAHLPTPPS